MSTTMTSRTMLVAALGLGAVAGTGATYLALTRHTAASPAASPAAVVATPLSPVQPATVSVRLSPEEVTRAHITLTPVEAATLSETLTIPAIVEPNTYKQTVVTALVAGRITRVLADLGQHVRRGQALAEVYSPELAEAQRTYISATAALDAHERQLTRLEALVVIGSASRQELEMAHSEHAALTTSVEGARTRLALLGLSGEQVTRLSSASQISAALEVRSPLDGTVTVRQANVGANVDSTMPLFTVADLSTVWVVGDLYEHDFPSVSVGRPIDVTFSALPDLALHSTISYIDPQLARDTRTAKVRAEVENRQAQLRLGMYAQMRIETVGGRTSPVIPKAALQTIGDHTVVYVVDPDRPDLFIERSIETGREVGDRVAVSSGVAVGESVVSSGSFFLRAERERLGQSAAAALSSSAGAPSPSAGRTRQAASITVSATGFEPARVVLKANVPAVITFMRTTDATCATEVVFPSLNIRRALPLNTPVAIELTPSHADLDFVCGVGMFKGAVAGE